MVRITGVAVLILCTALFVGAQTVSDSEFKKLNNELAQYYSKGEWDKALVVAERLVEISARDHGKDSLAVGMALKNRGVIEQEKGDLKRAEKSFDEGISVFKKNRAGFTKADGASFAELLESLGRIRARTGLLWTEDIFTEALEWRERSNGPNALETATPLARLANIQFARRDYKKSSEYYTRALKILAGISTVDNDLLTLIYYRTACVYRKSKTEDRFEPLKQLYLAATRETVLSKGPTLIDAGVVNGKATSLPRPAYPLEARRANAEGTVAVEILINEAGSVISACGRAGQNAALIEASETAAYGSKFSPTTLQGKAVKVDGLLTYHFRR